MPFLLRLMRIELVLPLIIGLQSGCLAVGGGYIGSDTFQPAFVTPERATYAKFYYRANDDAPHWATKDEMRLVEPATPRVIRKRELLAAWGAPDEMILNGQGERWVYRTGLRWNGIVVFPGIILPLPFVIPVGWNTFTVEFQQDTVQNITAVLNEVQGGGACTFVLVHGGLGCHFGKWFRMTFALKKSQIWGPRDLLGSNLP